MERYVDFSGELGRSALPVIYFSNSYGALKVDYPRKGEDMAPRHSWNWLPKNWMWVPCGG